MAFSSKVIVHTFTLFVKFYTLNALRTASANAQIQEEKLKVHSTDKRPTT